MAFQCGITYDYGQMALCRALGMPVDQQLAGLINMLEHNGMSEWFLIDSNLAISSLSSATVPLSYRTSNHSATPNPNKPLQNATELQIEQNIGLSFSLIALASIN